MMVLWVGFSKATSAASSNDDAATGFVTGRIPKFLRCHG